MAPSAISVENVSFSYTQNGRTPPILQGISFENAEGEFFCILGPSGCGKSTMLRLVAGFDMPTEGSVRVSGVPVAGPNVDRGVVFQGDDSLFTWMTARDNVAFGPRMRGIGRAKRQEQASRFMELVGLRGHEAKYPGELSGGMRQRIQIARVLVNNPRILLMDEPFGALDAQTRSELQDELTRIWMETKKTVMFITHDISEAILLADRVAVMRAGPAAGIREIIDISIPRPRSRASAEFGAAYERINKLIIDEVRQSRAIAA